MSVKPDRTASIYLRFAEGGVFWAVVEEKEDGSRINLGKFDRMKDAIKFVEGLADKVEYVYE